LGTATLALWSSTTSTSTKEGLPGQDTHDDFKPQVLQLKLTKASTEDPVKHALIYVSSPSDELPLANACKRSFGRDALDSTIYMSIAIDEASHCHLTGRGGWVQVKEGPAGSVNDIINQDLKNNEVFVYMKVIPTPLIWLIPTKDERQI